MVCLASTDRLFHKTAPLYQKHFLNASVYGLGTKRLCCEPRRFCLWMELVWANFSDIHSGTYLFTVLNMNVFNWFARLTERLIQLRSRRIWGDLTSQPGQVLYVLLCFVFTQVFDWDQCQYFPRKHYNNQDEAESMICKLRQESPGDKLVSVSSGQQVHLRLYHWVPHMPPTCLGFF